MEFSAEPVFDGSGSAVVPGFALVFGVHLRVVGANEISTGF